MYHVIVRSIVAVCMFIVVSLLSPLSPWFSGEAFTGGCCLLLPHSTLHTNTIDCLHSPLAGECSSLQEWASAAASSPHLHMLMSWGLYYQWTLNGIQSPACRYLYMSRGTRRCFTSNGHTDHSLYLLHTVELRWYHTNNIPITMKGLTQWRCLQQMA